MSTYTFSFAPSSSFPGFDNHVYEFLSSLKVWNQYFNGRIRVEAFDFAALLPNPALW